MSVSLRDARLRNQRLVGSQLRQPEDIVGWLGAVQAQDYAGAKWALGLRATGISDNDVEEAFNEGRVLRTHVLRPTWHFVTPADIRWMLALSAPRVHTFNAFPYRTLELDRQTLARSRKVLERVLRDRNHLTRAELQAVLGRGGVSADGMRLGYVMMHAELEQVVCSGPRRGKQFTYALVEERTPQARPLERDEALAELTRRYFSSHGPATVRDFVWWSGLTVRQAKIGLELLKGILVQETVGDRTYWLTPSTRAAHRVSLGTYLLPNYDEFLIAYKDRGTVVTSRNRTVSSEDVFSYHLIVDGRLAGSWKRTPNSASGLVTVEIAPYSPLTRRETQAVYAAAQRFAEFLKMKLALDFSR